ncbi:hypothetical protein [Candidatus Neptunichlamydia sp. REUL1]|uniref:hypothetical protein n=1 Tax=Candidatus Neptunichlamydia sp. REUL1 TaxID=3064277 RepID=UPI00292DF05E|nr:hypothetical protein [Candidatus Neptunochlamydia sp. REUL1]
MSVSIGCGPFPSFVYDRYLREPFMEGVHQAQYVVKETCHLSKKSFSAQVLKNIVSHSVQTAFLLVPAVNVIAFRVFLALRITINQSFERAVIKGDQEQVRNYLESGMDPKSGMDLNAKNLAGVPLLFQSLDAEVISMLIKGKADSKATDSNGGTFLEHLLLNGNVELAEELAQRKLFEVRPYLTDAFFDKVKDSQVCRTFLLHWGYGASIETRSRYTYDLKTTLFLERAIMTGQVNSIEGVLNSIELSALDESLADLKQTLPLLNTDWIWEHVLMGYCRGKAPGEVNDEWVIQLLNRGGKIEALNGIKFIGEGELIQRVIVSGKQELARSLVNGRFLTIDPFFEDRFLKPHATTKVTDISRDFVWFLVSMGYEKVIKTNYAQHYQEEVQGNILEKALVTCDEKALVRALEQNSMEAVIQAYGELKARFPRLKPSWAWEHLAANCFDGRRYEDFLTLVNQDFYQPTDAFYNARKPAEAVMYGSGSAEGYKALMKAGYRHGPFLKKQYGEELFDFENIAYCHDAEGLQRLAKDHGFQLIYDRFKELKSESPKMDTRWFWNALFTIPSTHFEQYRGIQAAQEVPPPPREYPLSDLLELYDKVDFSCISAAQLTDSTGGFQRTYTKELLRDNAVNRVKIGLDGSSRLEYTLSSEDKAKHIRQLQWIMHYLHEDLGENAFLSKSVGTIYAKMFLDCFACHSRWNEVFDIVRCSLGNIEMVVSDFDNQLQVPLGEHRRHLVYRLNHDPQILMKTQEFQGNLEVINWGRHAEGLPSLSAQQYAQRLAGDTHAQDNLVAHLRDSRGLPNPPVNGRLFSISSMYNNSVRTHQVFDEEYTPGDIIEVLYEFLGGNKDFYELMLDTFGTRIAPQWHGQDLELRRKAQEVGLDETLTIAALEEIGLIANRAAYSEEKFFSFLQDYGVTPKDSFEQAKDEYVARKKAEIDLDFKKKWYEVGVQKGHYTVNEPLESLLKGEIYFKIRNAEPELRDQIDLDWRRTPGDLETLLALSEYFDCTTKSLLAFYQTHPEISEDVRQKAPSGEIQKQLIYIAYQVMYEIASLPVGNYLAREEKGVFDEVVIPMEEYDIALKGDIHPLVLAKLLVDMGHLQPRVPELFQGVFNIPSQKSIFPASRIERRDLIKIFVALAALYGSYRWARSSVVGSPSWIYNKLRRTPEAQKV